MCHSPEAAINLQVETHSCACPSLYRGTPTAALPYARCCRLRQFCFNSAQLNSKKRLLTERYWEVVWEATNMMCSPGVKQGFYTAKPLALAASLLRSKKGYTPPKPD